MTLITLTTDFGVRDGFAAIMKGVIYGIAPDVKIVDISHGIAPQDIREGAYTLSRAMPFFPPGTIHIYVIDPGVGTKRRPLAARVGEYYFVSPDTGLSTPLIGGITESYGHKQPGDLVAVVDSEEYIEIAVVNGNAAQQHGAKEGDVVELSYKD